MFFCCSAKLIIFHMLTSKNYDFLRTFLFYGGFYKLPPYTYSAPFLSFATF